MTFYYWKNTALLLEQVQLNWLTQGLLDPIDADSLDDVEEEFSLSFLIIFQCI